MSLFGFIDELANPERIAKARETALREEINELVIDTCFCADTKKWETAIEVKGKWIVVEMYKDEQEAIKGHEKWCGECRINPNQEFKPCLNSWDWAMGNY